MIWLGLLIGVLLGFMLGWGLHAALPLEHYPIPSPIPPAIDELPLPVGPPIPPPAEDLRDGVRHCILYSHKWDEVSRRSVRGIAYPACLERPHGRQPLTRYGLHSILNGVGIYVEERPNG